MRLISLSWLLAVTAQAATPAQQFEHVQQLRAEARTLLRQEGSDDGARRQAARRLEEALAYLDRPDVAAQATGNVPLYMRGTDVRRDLAEQYAALGRNDDALTMLEQSTAYVLTPILADLLERTPAFAPLRNEPRFRAVVAANAAAGKVLGTAALVTPYRETLSIEERVAGLSLFWSEAREHFAFFDNVPELDWNRVYMDYLPKVMAARTTREYYDVLRTLAPLLKDGHTNIMAPGELADQLYATLPLAVALVQDKVLVLRVDDAALPIAVGDEIATIDGVPVRQYAQQHVLPLVSASTPHSAALYGYSDNLFNGATGTTVRLGVHAPDGLTREVEARRIPWNAKRRPASFAMRTLPGDIVHVAINSFETPEARDRFVAAFPEMRKAKGVVLDLRDNGGGDGSLGVEILRYFAAQPIAGARSYERGGEGLMRAQGMPVIRWLPMQSGPALYGDANPAAYTGPVALLIGPRTFSAGEDFALYFDIMKRGPIVGTATGGSTGQPLNFPLPGGGNARICVKRDVYPDGRTFVGKGILPTVEVPVTVADVRAGRDTQLEQAVAALRRR